MCCVFCRALKHCPPPDYLQQQRRGWGHPVGPGIACGPGTQKQPEGAVHAGLCLATGSAGLRGLLFCASVSHWDLLPRPSGLRSDLWPCLAPEEALGVSFARL